MTSKKNAKKQTPSKNMLAAVEDRPALAQLVRLLAKRRMTARTLMSEMNCSKPTVYARINSLVERGVKVKSTKTREGSSGPEADAFYL